MTYSASGYCRIHSTNAGIVKNICTRFTWGAIVS